MWTGPNHTSQTARVAPATAGVLRQFCFLWHNWPVKQLSQSIVTFLCHVLTFLYTNGRGEKANKQQRNHHGGQWKIVNWNDSFINPPHDYLVLWNFWSPTPSRTGFMAARQADDYLVVYKFFKLCNSTSRANLKHLNTFLGLIVLYQ